MSDEKIAEGEVEQITRRAAFGMIAAKTASYAAGGALAVGAVDMWLSASHNVDRDEAIEEAKRTGEPLDPKWEDEAELSLDQSVPFGGIIGGLLGFSIASGRASDLFKESAELCHDISRQRLKERIGAYKKEQRHLAPELDK